MDNQFIRDTYYRGGNQPIPRWMHDTRFEKLYLLDRWLDGTYYDVIPLSFEEEDSGGRYNRMRNRRPATKSNWPNQIAGLTARKLFGGRHVPRIKHTDKNQEQFILNVQALIEEVKLPVRMLEAVKRGSVGSVFIPFKFLKEKDTVKGVVNVKQTQYCTPIFNEFEELTGVMEHYTVFGGELIRRGLTRDRDGERIDPSLRYWFLKLLDTESETIYFPIMHYKWNPVEGGREYAEKGQEALIDYPLEDDAGNSINPFFHNLGFVQGVWIKNLAGGKEPDGLGTWELGVDNFIILDYQKSQNDRGLKYGATPQLVIKGNLKDEEDGTDGHRVIRSPSYEIRLAADEKFQGDQGGLTGHDAFLLETNGAAAKASDDFVKDLKHSTFEQLCAARKDLESISGAMSGKAIELIDEDYLDLVQELRLHYCTYGYLPLLKKICKAAAAAGHPLMSGVDEQTIDGLMIEFPPMYLPDPQDIQFLADAFKSLAMPDPIISKGADGTSQVEKPEPLLDPEKVREYFMSQLDMQEESANRPAINDTKIISEVLPEPQATETPVSTDADTLESHIYDDLVNKK